MSESANSSLYRAEGTVGAKPKLQEALEAAKSKQDNAVANLAMSKEAVYENYPFIGTLLKKSTEHYRLKENYYLSAPGTIEEVEDTYGTGEYQLRIPLENGGEHKIQFSIKTQDHDAFSDAKETSVREQNLEIELTEKTRRIARLEESKIDLLEEIDKKSRQLRDLKDDVTQAEINARKLFDEERKVLENKITAEKEKNDSLKEEKQQLDRKVFELEMEARFADRDAGFDWQGLAERVMESDALSTIFNTAMQKAAGPTATPDEPLKLHSRSNPEEPLNDAEQEEPMNTATQETGQAIAQQVVNAIYQKGIEQITAENPAFETVAPFVNQQLEMFTSQGFEFPAENWINIAKALVQYSVQNNVKTERLAGVIEPLVSNIPIAVKTLQTSPVKPAVMMLKNVFDLTLNDQETSVLVDVLTIFKNKLKGE
jgi:hypothetical protein